MANKMNESAQENIMYLLCFDEKHALTARGIVNAKMFENEVYRAIAEHAIEFIDKYKKPPKQHIFDLLESHIKKQSKTAQKQYPLVLEGMYSMEVNSEFVLDTLVEFANVQTIKGKILEAVESIQDSDIDGCKAHLKEAMQASHVEFDAGTMLFREESSRSMFAREDDIEFIPSGVDVLDSRGITPARGEVFLWIGPSNRGKSWALMNAGKRAAIARKKVLHITLEMSERKTAARYGRAFFGIGNKSVNTITEMITDVDGNIENLEQNEIKTLTLSNAEDVKTLRARHRSRRSRMPIIVKQFPTNRLTMAELDAYLESLKTLHDFVPDVVILDYADLMAVDPNNLRISTGNLYKDLRGLAVERDFALVTASQTNRGSFISHTVTMAEIAEDISKVMIADIIISMNQTTMEKKMNLMRLHAAKVRETAGAGILNILITTGYAVGQFCLSSFIAPTYNDLKEIIEDAGEGEEDEKD